jgi:hypothetical protein
MESAATYQARRKQGCGVVHAGLCHSAHRREGPGGGVKQMRGGQDNACSRTAGNQHLSPKLGPKPPQWQGPCMRQHACRGTWTHATITEMHHFPLGINVPTTHLSRGKQRGCVATLCSGQGPGEKVPGARHGGREGGQRRGAP